MLDKVEGAIKQTIQRNWLHWKVQSNRQSRETGYIGRRNQTDNPEKLVTLEAHKKTKINTTTKQKTICNGRHYK